MNSFICSTQLLRGHSVQNAELDTKITLIITTLEFLLFSNWIKLAIDSTFPLTLVCNFQESAIEDGTNIVH